MPTYFVELDLASAVQVILLGFVGGTLSGFIGSGGAFFMTPGMMNLGVPGIVAVGSGYRLRRQFDGHESGDIGILGENILIEDAGVH